MTIDDIRKALRRMALSGVDTVLYYTERARRALLPKPPAPDPKHRIKKNFARRDPDHITNGTKFETCNMSQKLAHTKIMWSLTGLIFVHCNMRNVELPRGTLIDPTPEEFKNRGEKWVLIDCSQVNVHQDIVDPPIPAPTPAPTGVE